jgi:hypothetical protein
VVDESVGASVTVASLEEASARASAASLGGASVEASVAPSKLPSPSGGPPVVLPPAALLHAGEDEAVPGGGQQMPSSDGLPKDAVEAKADFADVQTSPEAHSLLPFAAASVLPLKRAQRSPSP